MYKILIQTLLIVTLSIIPTRAMEEQRNVSDLLKILKIKNPTDLFYEALPYVKKYNEKEIENLEIDSELKNYALKLKNNINKKLFDPTITKKQQLKILLDFGADVNAQNERGDIVLSRATNKAKYKFVKLLLERRANPDMPNRRGITPLMEAAMSMGVYKAKDSKLIKIAKLLIENNANVNAVKNGDSALSFAAKALSDPMVELLLEHKADPNIESVAYHVTPLMYAVMKKTTEENKQSQINIIKMLMSHNAEPFKTNSKDQTAYDLAIEKGNTQIARVLWLAIEKKDEEQANVKKLMHVLQIKNPPALFYEALPIVEKYNEQEIETLEVDPELKEYAIELKNNMNKKLFDQTITKKHQFKVLLDFGADVNAQDENGNTPLSKAISNVDYEMVKLLLQRKADPNIANQQGFTPLIEAAINLNDRPEAELELIKIAIILIENNANVNALDQYGNNALLYAVKVFPSDKMVKLLLKHQAETNIKNSNHLTPLMYAAIERTADENRQRQINIVNLLIEYGAKLFTTNYYGETAYDLAASQKNNEIANILQEAMQKRGKEIYGIQKVSKNV